MAGDPTYLGTVQDVRGVSISVKMAAATVSGLGFVEGHAYRIGQVGSFVRIPLGYIDLFGIVSQVGAGAVPERLAEAEPHGFRWMTVELVGEGQRVGAFRRGVSQHPTVGDPVHLVTESVLARVYGRPDEPQYVRIGHLASSESIPALVDMNKLLTRHCALVGSTGSGKSTTVAGLTLSISDGQRFPSARILLLDLHGEYASALHDRATVLKANADVTDRESPLFVPYWAMTFDELIGISFGPLSGAERGHIADVVSDMKRDWVKRHPERGVEIEHVSVDSPIPFSIHRLWFDLHRDVNATHTVPATAQNRATEALLLDEAGKVVEPGDPMRVIPPKYRPQNSAAGSDKVYLSGSTLNIRKPLESLASRLRDPRFSFLFSPGSCAVGDEGDCEQDLDGILDQWLGADNPIVVLDLSGIPRSVLTEQIGVVLRVTYDALFWSRNFHEGGRERPLFVVLEEAHLYLNASDSGGAAAAVRRIVKEGRKYGVGVMIVSQRPAEIDPTILSQCGTIIALRLSNPADRAHVTSAAADNLAGLLSMLPILRTGEAIIVGEAVHLPTRTLVEPPPVNRRPRSDDPLIFDAHNPGGWNNQRPAASDYCTVVRAWRNVDARHPASRAPIGKEENVQRTPIESSNISGVGYDSETATLEIEFTNGRIYQYFDVSPTVHSEFMLADSKGAYFSSVIKGNYRYARL